jgi:hypothetical protein
MRSDARSSWTSGDAGRVVGPRATGSIEAPDRS